MNIYQENILDNYKNPRHFGKPEWSPTHTAKLQNLACGDEIEVFLMIDDNKVKDIAFTGEGCSIAIAAASILTDDLIGKRIEDIEEINEEEFLKKLGIELTPTRQKCGLLGFQAVSVAIGSKV